MPSKNYTAPAIPFAQSLTQALLTDPAIGLAGVTIERVLIRSGSTTVEVTADVDPTPADTEIQAVIDAHDPAADFEADPEFLAQQARLRGALTPFYIGEFGDVSDLPSPTMNAAVAAVTGEGLYARSGGAWVFVAPDSAGTLIAQQETAQAGGDPLDCVSSYTRLTGCVWDRDFIRSTAGVPAWQARAFAGTLATSGDRIDFPSWAAQPEGGSLAVIFLPAGTSPAPSTSSTLSGTWGGQWEGGFSLIYQSNRWQMRAQGSSGSGFPSSGPRLDPGDQLLITVLANGRIEVRNRGSARSSNFSLPVDGLDVWVVFERAHQRWPAAFPTLAAAPTPGTPDGPDTTAYVPSAAVSFDGVDDRVELPNSGAGDVLLWDTDWTLSVRLPSNDDIDTTSYQNMAGRGPLNAIGLNRVGSTLRVHAWRQSANLTWQTLSIPGSTDLSGAVVFFCYDAVAAEILVHIDEDLVATIPASNFAATATYTGADLMFGNMVLGGTSVYGGWDGVMHEVFWLGRLITDQERDDAVRDPNLANHSWFGDVVGWLPMGTDDTYPTMTNRVAGAPDGTLVNAPASSIVEI